MWEDEPKCEKCGKHMMVARNAKICINGCNLPPMTEERRRQLQPAIDELLAIDVRDPEYPKKVGQWLDKHGPNSTYHD